MSRPRPLVGVRVLDLSRVISGPYVGRVFADLGADVVKVESPDGDLTDLAGVVRHGRSGLFAHMNAGKRNIGIDLTAAGSPDLIRSLVAEADVVVENFRPSVMPRHGLGWDDLRHINQRLVMLSISGFGSGSEISERRAFAPIVHAESGLLIRHAELDGRLPSDVPLALGDMLTALHGVIAVMAALRLRELTGRGEHIDLSMLEAMVTTDDYSHFAVDESFEEYPTQGSVWPTRQGPILLAGSAKHIWATLHAARSVNSDEPRGADLATKVASRRRALDAWFQSFESRGDLTAALDDAGLAWAELTDPRDVLASPAFVDRPIAVEPPGPESRSVVRTPYRIGDVDTTPRFAARRRGADNDEVLTEWLGLRDADAAALVEAGVLISQPPGD